jgi:hypothetical protein
MKAIPQIGAKKSTLKKYVGHYAVLARRSATIASASTQ